jgi:hypothetical protein
VNKIELLNEDDMRAMINMDRVFEHRSRALSPDHPVLRGTAQNPDVFFQIREPPLLFTMLARQLYKPLWTSFRSLLAERIGCSNTSGLQMLTASSS